MTDRRDQYICAALAGLLANTDTEGAMQDIAADAVNLADAALAAAGGMTIRCIAATWSTSWPSVTRRERGSGDGRNRAWQPND
jgi:hypothetical protein